jgi:predicted ATPase
MQQAAPGQILVSEAAHRAASTSFAWEELPPIKVKGKSQPVSVFSLNSRRMRQGESLQAAVYTMPLVGRKDELALCRAKLAEAINRHGQIVGLFGDAGMGKSRLLAEVVTLALDRGLVGYGGECQSYGTNTSYLVWQPIWRGFFNLDSSVEVAGQIEQIRQTLHEIDPVLVSRLPLLSAVLNLPIPENDLTAMLDAKLRKSSLEGLLVDCLRHRAAKQPLLLVFEDCHWLDPLSHDLLEVVGRAIVDLPVLMVTTLRPPDLQRLQTTRLSTLPNFVEIRLTEMPPVEVETMIRFKLAQFNLAAEAVARELQARIVARAEGNPFYVEELLNYLHHRGVDLSDQQAVEAIELPTSLHSLVLSRMDQLAESQKTALKVASVIGRLFGAAMLWGVYPDLGDLERIKSDLRTLDALELTMVEKPEPELTYLFKHIITQEAAYESLPYATRALLHDQIGRYLEENHGGNLNQVIYLLAHHFEHSGNVSKRIEYLRKAGELAQADYNNEAALDYFRRVLPLLPPTEQINIRLKLGEVLQLVGHWQEAGDVYQQALTLAEQSKDKQAEAWCRTAIGELLRKRGRFAESANWLEQALAGFEELNDQAGVAQVYHFGGTLAAQQGDFETAKRRYESSLAIRRELNDEPRIASLLSNLGVIARQQGDYDTAQKFYEESLVIRWRTGDRWAIAVSLNNLGSLALAQGDHAVAHLRLEEAITLQREVGDRSALAVTLGTLAAPFSLTGQPSIVVPVPDGSDQAPVGVQVVGRHGSDAALLQLAAAVQPHLEWLSFAPPIFAT